VLPEKNNVSAGRFPRRDAGPQNSSLPKTLPHGKVWNEKKRLVLKPYIFMDSFLAFKGENATWQGAGRRGRSKKAPAGILKS